MGSVVTVVTVGTRELVAQSGASYRQIDYWTRVGLLEAENDEPGSGHHRRYPVEAVAVARALARWAAIEVEGRRRLAEVARTGSDAPVVLAPGVYVIPAELAAAS